MSEILGFWFGFVMGGLTLGYCGIIAGMLLADWRRGLPARIAAWVERRLS